MILADTPDAAARTTLDDLFRRAAVRHPDALALVDPPNRAAFTGGTPRSLSYAEADRIVWAIAKRLRRLGLQTDAMIGLQLPNTVEGVLTLLGVLRSGMIAALLPMLWRKAEIVAALNGIGSRMLITSAGIGGERSCDTAMQAAAALFSIRYVGAFGTSLPDGVVALDEVFASDHPGVFAAIPRGGDPAAHAAVLTWEVTSAGTLAVARNHQHLIGGGLAVFLEGGIENDADILSAIPPASFAGIATTIVPWLLSGGTLMLHHPFDADTFAAQCDGLGAGTVVVPGALASRFFDSPELGGDAKNIVALWRAPERIAAISSQSRRRVDVTAFAETGLVVSRRAARGTQAAVPNGKISVPHGTPAAVHILDTMRNDSGTLALRGNMVSAALFPPGTQRGDVTDDGFVDTGYPCRLDAATNTLAITGPQPGITAVGGYRFAQAQLDALVADISRDATLVALPDPLTGQRLAGASPDAAMRTKLAETGCNPLISNAFGLRHAPDAAAL